MALSARVRTPHGCRLFSVAAWRSRAPSFVAAAPPRHAAVAAAARSPFLRSLAPSLRRVRVRSASRLLRPSPPPPPARRALCSLADMPELPSSSYQHERSVALSAVAHASRLARSQQSKFVSDGALTKKDNSPVTVADFAVQALVVHKLLNAFPQDKFIAEETTNALVNDPHLLHAVVNATGLSKEQVLSAIAVCSHDGGDGARTWILDPIDGTRGFIAMRQYCIALGFMEGGVVQLGVLGCPNLPFKPPIKTADLVHKREQVGCIFHAVLGGGSWMTSEADIRPGDASPSSVLQHSAHLRCHVSDIANPKSSVFCESVESAHSSHHLSAQVASVLGVTAHPVRMDSQAKYGCMARGDFSIFLRFPKPGYVENVWDSAPAAIIVEEAGGRVTDGKGTPLNFSLGRTMDNQDGIVATNGIVHDKVIQAVQQVLSETRNSASHPSRDE